MSKETMPSQPIARRGFAFALRDVLPLPIGRYSYVFHENCPAGRECKGVDGCRATEIELVQQPGNIEIGRAMSGLSRAVADRDRDASSNQEDASTALAIPGLASFLIGIAVVDSAAADPIGDAFDRVMKYARMRIDSLRIATGAHIAAMNFERVHPMYLPLEVGDDGSLKVAGLVIDEARIDAFGQREATPEQLRQADEFLEAGSRDDPVETVRDLASRAETALRDGDYMSSIILAATTSEVLIKTLASACVWEEKKYRKSGASWTMGRSSLLRAFASTITEEVLPGALGDCWRSASVGDPLWNWRERLYRVRNRLVHEGHRPSYDEASSALAALHELSAYIGDRLAYRAQMFPRTALILLGRERLEVRGAYGKVRATARSGAERGLDFSAEYLAWIKGTAEGPSR